MPCCINIDDEQSREMAEEVGITIWSCFIFPTQNFGKRPVSVKFISRVIAIVQKECTDNLQKDEAEKSFMKLVIKRSETLF
jgi:hypothetical protein